MSTIHEGLKRAQKQRDARHLKYPGVLTARGKQRSLFGLGVALGGALFLILISLTLVPSSWWDFRASNPRTESVPAKIAQEPRKEDIPNAKGIYGRARDLQKRGLLADARRLYKETLRLDPGYGDALNNLGVIYIHEKNYLAAQRSLEKAIRLKPKYVEAYYNLACLHAMSGEVEQSLTYLRKAVSLDPSVRDWARNDPDLGSLSKMPEFEEIVGKD
jgi:tetratricopeptide (TPR) repeat protein